MAHGEGHAVGVDEKIVSPRLVYGYYGSTNWVVDIYQNGTDTVAMVRPTPALEALGEGPTGVLKGLKRKVRPLLRSATTTSALPVSLCGSGTSRCTLWGEGDDDAHD
jgi:hypothetical protein